MGGAASIGWQVSQALLVESLKNRFSRSFLASCRMTDVGVTGQLSARSERPENG
jgi:hypothetical protein